MPGDLKYSFFPNSGSEAVEGAVKMAYKYHEGERNSLSVSDISFHGNFRCCHTKSPELHFNFLKFKMLKNLNTILYLALRILIENNPTKYFAVMAEPFQLQASLSFLMSFFAN